MKINIITQPLFVNYGGILQNYALQETLRRLGHNPVTINVPVPRAGGRATWKDYIKAIRNYFRKLKGEYQYPFYNPAKFAVKERQLSFPQRAFVDKYINKKDVQAPFTSGTEIENPADMWIVGSDQVWRPWCNRFIENEFFDFLDDNTPRIAYAASFGTDKWEIAENLTPEIKELAGKFKAISVREASGVELCRNYLDVDAKHVLDPTMLLTAEDYLRLTNDSDYPEGDYIAAYILDINSQKTKVLKEISKEKRLPVHKVGQMHRDRYDSIESWLATIAHARFVVTDSFHGTVFSLIFGRPVKVLGNNLRGNSRLQSLFDMLDVKVDPEGFVYPDKKLKEHIGNLREMSFNFLAKSWSNNG